MKKEIHVVTVLYHYYNDHNKLESFTLVEGAYTSVEQAEKACSNVEKFHEKFERLFIGYGYKFYSAYPIVTYYVPFVDDKK
jgi:hypothetical protein